MGTNLTKQKSRGKGQHDYYTPLTAVLHGKRRPVLEGKRVYTLRRGMGERDTHRTQKRTKQNEIFE